MVQQLVFNAPRRGRPPRHLADLDEQGRVSAVAELGLPAFRAKQLAHQYYGRLIADPRQMTDLPAAIRGTVAESMFPTLLTAARDITCDEGQTRKTLWRAVDGATFESVLMRYPQRNTVCISSQAGCGMACPFCATGQGGWTATCPPRKSSSRCAPAPQPCATTSVTASRTWFSWAWGSRWRTTPGWWLPYAGSPIRESGFGISARSVTVSTVGLAPAIRKLADERLGVTLALSLHAPDDELRDTLVPVNDRWKITEALDAARYYAELTGRRVSIEYALIRDVNDQPWRADLLGKRLHRALGPLVHVNLIPLNPTPGSDWDASPKPVEREFVRRVRSQGVSCTVRDTRGREIGAACGQLAREG